MEDVVVIGAGLSGLTAAQQLHRAGYRVIVVEKSRGLGGRLATRRLGSTAIDHGCRYLQPFTDPSLSPIPSLLAAGELQPWQPETFALTADGSLTAVAPSTGSETIYVAPKGMSSVAKALAPDLTIYRQWRATDLSPTPLGWRITGECLGSAPQGPSSTIEAKAVVLAIPAPQAAALLGAAAEQSADLKALVLRLQAVEFEAVIAVMAGYGPQTSSCLDMQQSSGGWMITADHHPTLGWIALDSSKRTDPDEPVVVIHSSPNFAAKNLETTDLNAVGQTLLTAAGQLQPWLGSPQWMQVHRWRYGLVGQPLGNITLSNPAVPGLVGCGDWCLGGNAEGAIASGHQAATAISPWLRG